jgi:hypothetical protein
MVIVFISHNYDSKHTVRGGDLLADALTINRMAEKTITIA